MFNNGKLKQQYIRFKKRRLFIYIAAFLVLFSIGTGILAWIGLFGSRAELCSIKVSQNNNSLQSLQGLGVNLDYIPLNNYVKNSSFESENVYDTFVLADAKEDYVFMSPEEHDNLKLSDNALIGSLARIYTIDERGVMSLIAESTITDYINASFGSYDEIQDTNWYWTQDPLIELTNYQNVLTGITTSGKLVSDISSESFSKMISAEDDRFVDIDASSSNVIAVTAKGYFYYSSDGINFVNKMGLNSNVDLYDTLVSGEVSIVDIASLGDKAATLLSDGSLYICTSSSAYKCEWFDSEVKYVTSSDNRIVVVLANGKVFSSDNALVFNEEKEIEKLVGASLVKGVSSTTTSSALLLSDNRVVFIDDNCSEMAVKEDTAYIRLLADNCILGVLSNNSIYISTTTGTTILASSENSIDNIYVGNNEQVYLLSGGKIYKTSVFTGIKLAEHIPEESVYSGDICCIEKTIGACQGYVYSSDNETSSELWNLSSDVMSWDIYGNGTSVTTIDEAPVGYGVKCARVLGTSEDYHVISQKLADKGSDLFIENAFLRLELQLMQVNCENKTVKIWLSSEGCEDVGFVVDECASKFTSYSNVFIASDELLKSENEIRLNIAFENIGELRIDGIYLGLDKYSETSIPREFTDAITKSSPSVIRLNNLGIGSYGISYDSLYSISANSNSKYIDEETGLVNNCASLEDSMRIVKDSGAYPWLVIGSSANQNSVASLLDYLCGSVTSDYGKKRIDNGTAVPWSRQFSNVIVEINDDDNIFLSDVQRSAYVNYIISLIRQSSYYKDFKDNIVFIDGMKYDGGTMLSFADYHCTSYVDDGVFENGITYIQDTNDMYREISTLSPRVKNDNGQGGEYISSLDILSCFGESNITLGECVSTLLSDDSTFARMILINLKVNCSQTDYSKLIDQNTQTMLNAFNTLEFSKYVNRVYCEIQKPLDESSPITVEQFNSDVGIYLLKSDKTYYLVVANASDNQEQFIVDGKDLSIDGASLKRYSSTGEEIQSETIKKFKNRYTIQAGQVIVFELKAE